MGNPTARSDSRCPTCSGARGYHGGGHGLASVPQGSRASFQPGQHTARAARCSLGRSADATGPAPGREGSAPTAATATRWRGTVAGRGASRCGDQGAMRSGDWREGAACASFPRSVSPGGRGRGRHLTARTNFSRLRGARGTAAGQGGRSARPMARSVNKSGPHAGPAGGEQRGAAASRRPSPRSRAETPAQPRDPAPGRSLSPRPQEPLERPPPRAAAVSGPAGRPPLSSPCVRSPR